MSVEHEVPAVDLASPGQSVSVPVQLSAGSHSPVEARHSVPPFPAGCWHVTLVPSQRSSVQTLPSSVQTVPDDFLTSAGHVALPPLHVSARSHSPAATRQVVPEVTNVQLEVQQELLVPLEAPASHCSEPSIVPLPHVT